VRKAKSYIIGVIPARYASTRFPGKPLADIFGKPMLQWVYENSKKSKLINEIIIATDDKRILDAANKFGCRAVLTSKRHKSGTDRICEAVQKIKCDIVVNIQGDEPFINAENIDRAIEPMLNDSRVLVSTIAVKIDNTADIRNPNKVKVIFDKNNFALYFSRSIIPFERNRAQYYKHIGLYVYRKKFLLEFAKMKRTKLEISEELEQLRILENGYKIKVVEVKEDSISVDTPSDLKKIKIHYKRRHN
jgi:3-deoxy-manno-octulosonate cytidylyltransferase (CMP-KDO synthetase)